MHLHESQTKAILSARGVAVPPGRVAETAEAAEAAARDLGGPVMVKAQVLAGGRGKAGGVVRAATPQDARAAAARLLGRRLATGQSSAEGILVSRVLVERQVAVDHERYLGMTVDGSAAAILALASREGGVEIEELARTRPGQIARVLVDPLVGLLPFQARELGQGLGLPRAAQPAWERFVGTAVSTFCELDGTLLECNPFAVTPDHQIIALDAKFTLDDNAGFRHPELTGLRDTSQEDPQEVEASRWNLSYVRLEGTIGCLVNGAGLAMATLDVVRRHGGEPANFLDVGGGASEEQVARAMELVAGDARVRAILVNIFGGIMRGDVLARGVVAAVRAARLAVPLVVRLEGTNQELGRRVLSESGIRLQVADGMDDAARQVVAAARGRG